MKKILILLFLSLILFSCSNEVKNEVKKDQEIKKPDQNIDLNAKTGKRTFLSFVATWCPYCQKEMPVYDKFYRDYKDKVNMQIVVLDWKKFPEDYSIPQDISNPITYEQATKEKCDYVPSYIIYDENKNIIDKQCWAMLTYEQLSEKLLTPESVSDRWNTLDTNQTNIANTSYQTEKFKDWDIWVIMTTTIWKLEIKLFPKDAPKTTLNFLGLAKKWYYNNSIFHRVIKDFMIQWGDPTWTWMWGESIFGKDFEDEFSPNIKNIRWSVSMANSGPNTNWSQFFINQKDNNFLDNKHSVFWQVINGLDNVDKIAWVKTDSNDKPEKDVKIIKMEVVKFESWTLKPYDFSLEEELKKIEDSKKAKKEKDKNRVVKAWDRIVVNYIWKTAIDNKEFDNSYKRGTPIEFEVWAWIVIKGFDTWVLWMKIWDKRTLNIKAADAYWEYDPKNIKEVKKTELKQFEEAWYKLEAWTKLKTIYWEFTIKEVSKDTVKIDLNHFLAWKDLIFEVEMVEFKN